jgi:hypothetical protein
MQFVNISTWNCTGVMSSASYLSDLLQNHSIDICGMSEHWLFEHDLQFIYCINSHYTSYSIADPDLQYPSSRRVGKGGLGIMWHKRLTNRISPLYLSSRYVIGIESMIGPGCYMYIFRVYLPCKNHCVLIFKNSEEETETVICRYIDTVL